LGYAERLSVSKGHAADLMSMARTVLADSRALVDEVMTGVHSGPTVAAL